MRIAYILKKFPRLSETFILNELLALQRLGHELEVFSLRAPDDEPRHEALAELRAPVTIVRPLAPKTVFAHLDALARKLPHSAEELRGWVERLELVDPWRLEALAFTVPLAPMITERGIEHLHAHFATSAAATAQEVQLRTGVPFSFTMHAKDICRESVNFEVLAHRMSAAAFCVTVCEENARWLRERCGEEAAERLHVLYNGIDLDKWRPSANPKKEPPLLLAIGRLVEKKGFDDFLRAMAILKATGAGFRAQLIGSGELEDNLKRMAAELGLGECLEFTGAMTQEAVRLRLSEASLLVAPCITGSDGNRDALPTVMLEAMACGVPCIGTDVGGLPEIVRDGVNGWIVAQRDPEAIARVIEEALSGPGLLARFGSAARQRAEEEFSLARNAARLGEWMMASSRAAALSPGAMHA